MRDWRQRLIALVLAGMASWAHGQILREFTIHPPAPRAFEHVELRPKGDVCQGIGSRVERVGPDFVVTFYRSYEFITCLPIIGTIYRPEIGLGAFPPGTYTVKVVNEGDIQIAPSRQLEFTVAAGAPSNPPSAFRPQNDYSGHWWNPKESGWGLSIHQSPSDPMMVVLYVYDAAGQPVWYVAPGGRWRAETVWEAPLHRTKGPPMSGSFDPSRVERVVVGTARLSWYGVDTGDFPNAEPVLHFRYAIDGIEHVKLIQKLPF